MAGGIKNRKGIRWYKFPYEPDIFYSDPDYVIPHDIEAGVTSVGVVIDLEPPARGRNEPHDPAAAMSDSYVDKCRELIWEQDQRLLAELAKLNSASKGGRRSFGTTKKKKDRNDEVKDDAEDIKAREPDMTEWKIAGELMDKFDLSQRHLYRIIKS